MGRPEQQAEARAQLPRYGLELLAVLAVTYGTKGIQSLLGLVRRTVESGTLSQRGGTTPPIQQGQETPNLQWLDILDHLVSLFADIAPILLVLLLLARSPGGPGFGIGLDRLRVREVGQGLGFAAIIGIPGLALVYGAYRLGFNARIDVVQFADVWYRVPDLLLEAFQQGASEEIIVCAYVLTRLRQLGWTDSRALGVSAVLRGSYHLYQGFGGFVGNAIMALIFGWWFQRTKRVWPLVIAHSVIDAVSFIGYIYLADHLDWI